LPVRSAALALAAILAGCAAPPPPAPPPVAPAPIIATPPRGPLSGPACLAALSGLGAGFTGTAQPAPSGPCNIDTPIRATNLAIALSAPAVMSCGLAETVSRWQRDVVQPDARRWLGQEVTAIRHYGAFACRNEVGGGRPGHLSQHALGRALDVSGFVLKDGTKIGIEKDWLSDGPRGRFLHAIAAAACGYFSVVLTPATNSAHRDHLHLDIGPERFCGAP
jgi:hypothetical protein